MWWWCRWRGAGDPLKTREVCVSKMEVEDGSEPFIHRHDLEWIWFVLNFAPGDAKRRSEARWASGRSGSGRLPAFHAQPIGLRRRLQP